jgi:hypothetical protein
MNYDWCFQEGIDDSKQAWLLKALEPLVTPWFSDTRLELRARLDKYGENRTEASLYDARARVNRRCGLKRPSRSSGFVRNRLLNFPKRTEPAISSLLPGYKRGWKGHFIERSAKSRLKSENSARRRSGLLGLIAASLV